MNFGHLPLPQLLSLLPMFLPHCCLPSAAIYLSLAQAPLQPRAGSTEHKLVPAPHSLLQLHTAAIVAAATATLVPVMWPELLSPPLLAGLQMEAAHALCP